MMVSFMPKVLSLEKSLTILEAVFESKSGIGTRAMQQKLGYNVATIHNIARTFCARGYLRQDPDTKLFFPGMRLMLLGRHPSYHYLLTESAAPIVEEVSEQMNESILLAAIDHGKIINLKYVACKQALLVQEPDDVSDHSYCTAFGKILLASLSEPELEAYLRNYPLRALTPRTLSTPELLKAELLKVKKNNYAQTRDEYSEGVSAVAVPIRDSWGTIIASIGASAPTLRMQKEGRFEHNLATLTDPAAKIERIWGKALSQESVKKITARFHRSG